MRASLKTVDNAASLRTGCLVVPVHEGSRTDTLAALDRASAGRLGKVMKAEHFSGATGKTLLLHGVDGIAAPRVLLLGLGKADALEAGGFRRAIGAALSATAATGSEEAVLLADGIAVKGRDSAWQARQIGTLSQTGSYRYTRTLSKPEAAPRLVRLVVALPGRPARGLAAALAEGAAIGRGMNLARELGNTPANICTPSHLAAQARALARRHPRLRCRVLDERRMRELGMHSLLSVTAGTREPARLIVLEYRGAARSERPHALVGKGITFDSGGISLKPGAAMDEMKFDMCGAAAVLGTMQAIAETGPALNAVAVVAACENMPSGTATRPGDVVRSMEGITIEILNTDAEGRLILCDAITYVKRFEPQTIVDVATLTGACVVALGKHASGLFSNDDTLAGELLAAGEESHDRAWRMPLWDDYQEQLKSNFADVANIGGPNAGSVTAACFLARFAKGRRWAHLDIAGTAWEQGAAKGATGRPVGLLSRYLLARAKR
ncbi:MAG: leucyl aminopeptidase [Gammaproteobacteria bacterium]